ncbi:RNA-binding transcriptional accessory protein [Nitrogeniibacter mangrovi]|uniref:RNA-binding transcriptional accessory protein n=1 Tax=Nitrogeniibacter mangrovi TaxID=2016596 RepID=A0A6C1B2C2_9RHOO|nr:Tex family protein [Nitrogeniibacter mangrovi]QID17786.1 RNA-binding transcriptional accessory protein [Nitrogeniibacter mangrovi]
MPASIAHRLAEELQVAERQVAATIRLLDEGATVPFIARYRKEVTGGLDDTQLRTLDDRLGYLRELDDRRATILESIAAQGKLDDALRGQIDAADTKQRLEDLYLPYKPKRRTKAQIAREAGLAPLADALLADPTQVPDEAAIAYLNPEAGITDAKAALDGARQILVEQFSEDAELLDALRTHLSAHGRLVSQVVAGKEEDGAKFRDWFDFSEPLKSIPSHRCLALLRGRNEGVLRLSVALPDTPAPGELGPCESRIARQAGIRDQGRAADKWLLDTARWAWTVKISVHLELELMNGVRERAEEEAIAVFARNLKDLLLAAPAGPRATLGLDPGLRTGVKVAVVDATGKLLDTATIYPHEPRRDWDGAIATLAKLAKAHNVELVAIGNGTASRETDKLAAELMQRHPELKLTRVMVSEAGASVYSASQTAADEFPDLDVSLRGAVSIARRLQDPLAELVKIDPKSIGVGQYQHDVNQSRLARMLDAVVEDCVNAVGVDVNTASAALLTRISGLNRTLADNIVAHRDAHGAFADRKALKAVPRLGDKTFEQAAGFLRVMNGSNPLDASAVHPEAYPVVERILADIQRKVRDIMGDSSALKALDPKRYADERFGEPTVRDILQELDKPGRDPRPAFQTARFKDGVEKLTDLVDGMVLEGVVTNVTNFGAFVDVGVHQDGLVHISMLADRFVKDPHSVVKAGDVVKVKVLEVDPKRKRISLSMRMDAPAERKARQEAPRPDRDRPRKPPRDKARAPQGSMADALSKALRK